MLRVTCGLIREGRRLGPKWSCHNPPQSSCNMFVSFLGVIGFLLTSILWILAVGSFSVFYCFICLLSKCFGSVSWFVLFMCCDSTYAGFLTVDIVRRSFLPKVINPLLTQKKTNYFLSSWVIN